MRQAARLVKLENCGDMRLNQLKDNPGARTAPKRRGRGMASGLGKTAGRGHKGAKSRSGTAIKGFEGGQMPIYRRLPKRGFVNIFRKNYQIVNLGRLQRAIDAGKLDASKPIGAGELVAAGLVRRPKDGIRLLAKGELNTNLTIEVTGASKAAVAGVEKAGGSVQIIDDGRPEPKLGKKAARKAKAKARAESAGGDDAEA